MSLKTETKVIVDRSPMHDLLRINFNISFTKMSCEHLTLDVSDSLGSVRTHHGTHEPIAELQTRYHLPCMHS
jgi:Endoplasmic Reticulum-Golgi Intermediate Compartment (ERGIC)